MAAKACEDLIVGKQYIEIGPEQATHMDETKPSAQLR